MKRYIAAGLAAMLLCSAGVPAYAAQRPAPAQTETAQQTAPVRLTFDTLEQTVRRNNISIKANDSTVKSAEETDVSNSYFMNYLSLSGQIEGYQKQIKALSETIAALPADDPMRAALTAQLQTLRASLAGAQSAYTDLDDQEDDAKKDHERTIERTQREMQNDSDQICRDAQDNYIALQTLRYAQNATDRSLAQLDRNIAAVQKQVQLGMAGTNQLAALQSQRQALDASRSAQQTQYDSVRNVLTLQCGYPLGTELVLDALPTVTQAQLDALDYARDLEQVLAHSYTVWQKKDAAEQAARDYLNDVTDNEHAAQAAKITCDAERENVTAAFRKLYQQVAQKRTALQAAYGDLQQAQKTFRVQQVQYRLGMIARLAYADAEGALQAAQEAAATAEIDLLAAYQAYQWALRGVMTSTAAA
ncbi:MAG: hypothetical protein Q4D31_03510 [Eubacteriales bacterium]|nr:hypothetical protein [Eubacteriales bacterium]